MIKYELVGIGSAIMDMITFVNDDFLANHNLVKGSMNLIDAIKTDYFYNKLRYSGTKCGGGSAVNTTVNYTKLGGSSAFIGKIGSDQLGYFFSDDLVFNHVRSFIKIADEEKTALCIVLVTPDGERTMLTHLGAALTLNINDIDVEVIKDSKMLFLESYLFDVCPDCISKATKVLKENGKDVAISLSDSLCVTRNKDKIVSFIKEFKPIIFGNTGEYCAMFGIEHNKDISDFSKMEELSERFVITRSEHGATAFFNGKYYEDKPEPVKNIVDLTGAGDVFAAGFLYKFLDTDKVEESLKFANQQAGAIIQKIGARL